MERSTQIAVNGITRGDSYDDDELEYGFLAMETQNDSKINNAKYNTEKDNSLYIEILNYICHRDVELRYMDDWAIIKMFMERDEDSLNCDVNFLLKVEDLLQIISHLSYINAFKGKPETKCNFDMAFLCLWKQLYVMFESNRRI